MQKPTISEEEVEIRLQTMRAIVDEHNGKPHKPICRMDVHLHLKDILSKKLHTLTSSEIDRSREAVLKCWNERFDLQNEPLMPADLKGSRKMKRRCLQTVRRKNLRGRCKLNCVLGEKYCYLHLPPPKEVVKEATQKLLEYKKAMEG